jgi:hypothetical protein
LARNLLREQLLDGRVLVTWVVREPTPGPAYVLNRFLVLVLLELSQRGPRQCIFDYYSSKIWDIVPTNGAAASGVGKMHTVRVGPAGGNADHATPVGANLILIRHGVDPVPPVLNGAAPVTDQILPLGCP